MTDIIAVNLENILSQIYTIRGKQVMMDRHLAVLSSVATKNLNKAVGRNISREPVDFQLDQIFSLYCRR